jgi:radical SAM protein with 4Fe4S-binding SPASM domain
VSDSSYAVTQPVARFNPWGDRPLILGSLDIELTERCNNDCMHCSINLPAGDMAARERELTTEQWKAVLTQAVGVGALSVRFTGGEPMLRHDFEELYLFARRLGLKVLIFTNARLVTPRLADLLAHIPPLDPMEITVYGMTERSYNAAVRVRGAYAQFARGVALLLDRGVPFVVKGALLPPNRAETERLESWAATLPGMDRPPGHSMHFTLRGRRDSEVRNNVIRKVRVSPEAGIRVITRRRQGYVEGMRQFCSRFIGPHGDALFSCGAGHDISVDAYGVAQACLTLRDPDTVFNLRHGDEIRKGALSEALVEFFPKLRTTRTENPEYLRRCARCFLKGLCEQCPAKSWAEHGTLDTPVEYFCSVAHAQARDLGLLRDGESAWEVEDWEERIAWIR